MKEDNNGILLIKALLGFAMLGAGLYFLLS